MHYVLCTAYFAVLSVLAMYGLHRSHLVITVLRNRATLRGLKEGVPALSPEAVRESGDLPHVTVQLPLYNEATVAARLLDHVAAIDWPRDRFEIQVLDDSTDETRALVRAEGRRAARERRSTSSTSTGSTAPATRRARSTTALKVAKGDLVAIFDADFLPQPDFLRAVVPHFMSDPQGRHGAGPLGAPQSRALAAHAHAGPDARRAPPGREPRARRRRGGSSTSAAPAACGARRPSPSAGGWQHDTLTEDLDLSYRAQLAGWRFVYRENVVTPGRAAGRHQRLPRAAVPLGQGHGADRAQAPGPR